MATLSWSKRKTNGRLDAGYRAAVRVLDFVVDLSADVTMGTATDTINLATLPAGAIIVAAGIEQVTAGTGTGTLVLRSDTTAITGTLASTATAGAWAANLPAVCPATVATAVELNLLGATAVRTDGKIRVVVAIVEGSRSPSVPSSAARDALA